MRYKDLRSYHSNVLLHRKPLVKDVLASGFAMTDPLGSPGAIIIIVLIAFIGEGVIEKEPYTCQSNYRWYSS